MLVTLNEVKTALRLEEGFTEHDAYLSMLIKAAQRYIERQWHCRLVHHPDELPRLPAGVRGFLIQEDIKLAAMMLVTLWYEHPSPLAPEAQTDIPYSVSHLLAGLREQAMG